MKQNDKYVRYNNGKWELRTIGINKVDKVFVSYPALIDYLNGCNTQWAKNSLIFLNGFFERG